MIIPPNTFAEFKKEEKMERSEAIHHVVYVVDDAGNGRKRGDDLHAIVRTDKDTSRWFGSFRYPSVLVGWQFASHVIFVAVHAYLDAKITDDEARAIARNYLCEIHFASSDYDRPADYLIR